MPMSISKRSSTRCCIAACLVTLVGFTHVSRAIAQASPDAASESTDVDSIDAEEQKQIELANRFMGILEKNPRRGTALDRVYGHHIEFGSLDAFIKQLRDELTKDIDNGAKWIILGLIESQRGEDLAAIEAFNQAEQLRTEDALPAFYAGQSLIRMGQVDQAIEALERSIARNPTRSDLIEVYQQLGRTLQRMQRSNEALAVWKRFEDQFPDDLRVLEQIAMALAEENQHADALPRYQRLIELTKDDYRKSTFRIAAAEQKIKTNQLQAGLADFEGVLNDLNPTGWLYRDVRRRIEEVFLKSSDQDALVSYYEKWLEKNPDDIDTMGRLSMFLSDAARMPESLSWIEKAISLAPTRVDLRKSYIDQLVEQQRLVEAANQYRELCSFDPTNLDARREWGRLVFRNQQIDEATRRTEVTAIWNAMLTGKSNDALLYSQVADLFRNANINDRAMEFYQQAVAIAPNEPQYREYLGEFYFLQKRTDDAMKTWASIAEGSRHTAENVTRLAEIYHRFGYMNEAIATIDEACQLSPNDFAIRLQSAQYAMDAAAFDKAITWLDQAEALVENEDQIATLTTARIEAYQASEQLPAIVESLRGELTSDPKSTSARWHLLANYQAAMQDWPAAMESIHEAVNRVNANQKGNQTNDRTSITFRTTAAKILEQSGDIGRAADMYRQLATIDRRSQDAH
jgi:tetratricopeptide (TPR) repeat protein